MDLPSGVSADLQEVLIDTVGSETWIRFRFIAPKIARDSDSAPDFAMLEPDFSHLCVNLAVPYLQNYELEPDKVVISMSDRAVKFGLSDPDATQYFEQFRVEKGDCIWEGF
ncbi:hypothetical protein E4Z66_12025 [Aliishimia ponticola]|uniref:Acetolactate synthase n=2 Tax=Aliishimia ponticola TaxID=2499833 RepID=A0A4S4N985_9RHOB|nr:hypothetical protein E4Z66_12025 [Aliishimia ponticola]